MITNLNDVALTKAYTVYSKSGEVLCVTDSQKRAFKYRRDPECGRIDVWPKEGRVCDIYSIYFWHVGP